MKEWIMSMPNWVKAIVFAGIMAVVADLTDGKDFSFATTGGLQHLLEVFVGAILGAFALMFGKGAAATPPSSPPKTQ